MTETKIRNIISKYLAGESNAQEEHDLRHWVDQSPENAQLFEEMYTTWEGISQLPEARSFDLDKAWASIKSKSGISDATPAHKARSIPMRRLMRVAAAVILLTGLGMALYTWVIIPGMQPEMMTVETTGEQQHLFLPDSSEVWLNTNSQLAYEKDFSGKERRLTLRGEAFFDVQRNEEKPFVIQAGTTETRVLGTSFNVRAYETDTYIEVSVSSGKVSFGTQRQQVALTAGDQGTYSLDKQTIALATNLDENLIAWQSKRLVFNNSELSAVAEALERYFDITISFEEAYLAQCHYSGRFDQPDLEYVLEVISATMNMKYAIENAHIIFSGPGCR